MSTNLTVHLILRRQFIKGPEFETRRLHQLVLNDARAFHDRTAQITVLNISKNGFRLIFTTELKLIAYISTKISVYLFGKSTDVIFLSVTFVGAIVEAIKSIRC